MLRIVPHRVIHEHDKCLYSWVDHPFMNRFLRGPFGCLCCTIKFNMVSEPYSASVRWVPPALTLGGVLRIVPHRVIHDEHDKCLYSWVDHPLMNRFLRGPLGYLCCTIKFNNPFFSFHIRMRNREYQCLLVQVEKSLIKMVNSTLVNETKMLRGSYQCLLR